MSTITGPRVDLRVLWGDLPGACSDRAARLKDVMAPGLVLLLGADPVRERWVAEQRDIADLAILP